ncbi:MAG: DUF6434 domain-containing protein [Eubacteriales bacterium]|nr:DUF6434 domain-containing protein [Lachnospiraceae bacterium]MDO5128252.1 DUF6434 domain-containing protein [Eubacteriales bacterium]
MIETETTKHEKMERPPLAKGLDSDIFRDFYYLKEELVLFCRQNGLPTYGGKLALTERIAYYLDTGELAPENKIQRKKSVVSLITRNTIIEENFVCSERHRAFFKEQIGDSFSFPVAFQKWLKNNAGKTYEDAISAYYEIKKQKKMNKTTIDKQFEYNTYIRDFFENNKGKSLEDAIRCWKYKKQLPGHNRYEKSDLIAL